MIQRFKPRFRDHLKDLIQTHTPEPDLVSLEQPQHSLKENRLTRQNQPAGALEPELLLCLFKERDEGREVEEPGRNHEAAALLANVDGQGTGADAAAPAAGFVGSRRDEALHGLVPPPLHDLFQPYDSGYHVGPVDRH